MTFSQEREQHLFLPQTSVLYSLQSRWSQREMGVKDQRMQGEREREESKEKCKRRRESEKTREQASEKDK